MSGYYYYYYILFLCCCRCFHAAQTYSSIKKWKEAVSLYEKTLEYARTALDGYAKSQIEASKKEKVSKSK